MKLNSPLKRLVRVFVVALLVITTYLLIDGKVHSIILATENMFADLQWQSNIIGNELNKYRVNFESCENPEKFDSILKPQLVNIKTYLDDFERKFEVEDFRFFIVFGKDSLTHKIDFYSSQNLKASLLSAQDREMFNENELKQSEARIFVQLGGKGLLEEFVGVFTPLVNNKIKIIYSVYTPAQSWIDIIKEKLITNLLVVVFVIGFTFYFTYRSLRKIVRAEEEVKKQLISAREIIEEKNTEITDSIKYAKRLQTAVLLPTEELKKINPNAFIYYQPKDIVAGDFYWIQDTPGMLYVAAADCTGHGVPGAMVSMLCINLLNKSLQEIPNAKPNQLLYKVCEELKTLFNIGNEEIKDGMDISLLAFDKKLRKIYWSGAFNPLWVINGNGFTEIKADKQSVSGVGDVLPFTLHELNVDNDSWFYLFSDGYADQFGGPKNKKFRYKQLQELLISINKCSPEEQQNKLQSSFENWKGTQEQVDDVLVLGINFKYT